MIFTLTLASIFSLLILITIFIKGKVWGIMSGFAFGVLGLILILAIKPENINSARTTFNYISQIFILLMMMAIPFYLLTVIINFIMSENASKMQGKTWIVSFLSLLSLSLIGAIVAMLFIPLMYLIPNGWFSPNQGNLTAGSGDSASDIIGIIISYFSDWRLILSIIAISIIVGLILRFSIKNSEKYRKINNIAKISQDSITKYFEMVIYLVPFVIMTRLMSLGFSNLSNGDTDHSLSLMFIYMGFYWLGALLIFFALFMFNIMMSSKKMPVNEKIKILLNQVLTVFASQSTQAALPSTQKTSKELGVSEEISQLTPVKGTIMGMIMCNGFSPMLVLILSIMNKHQGNINPGELFAALGLILVLAITTSGTGSQDYFIILTVIASINVGNWFYLSIVMPVQEINERIIVRPNNSLGHIAATLTTEKFHQKHKKSKDV